MKAVFCSIGGDALLLALLLALLPHPPDSYSGLVSPLESKGN